MTTRWLTSTYNDLSQLWTHRLIQNIYSRHPVIISYGG